MSPELLFLSLWDRRASKADSKFTLLVVHIHAGFFGRVFYRSNATRGLSAACGMIISGCWLLVECTGIVRISHPTLYLFVF